MILSLAAALLAPGDLLPEINRASLDRQARLEARRQPASGAVRYRRDDGESAPISAAAAPRGRGSAAQPEISEPRAASQASIIGM